MVAFLALLNIHKLPGIESDPQLYKLVIHKGQNSGEKLAACVPWFLYPAVHAVGKGKSAFCF